MPYNITQSHFFCKTCIFIKQVKHIPKKPVTRAKIFGRIIYTELV